MFEFKISKKGLKSNARTGIFTTPHGTLQTPSLAIVATDGFIKGVSPEINPALPMDYNIVNTFHIYTKGLLPTIKNAGGIHAHGNFQSVIASDSGGFQVFSLGFGKAHQVGKIGGMFPEERKLADNTDRKTDYEADANNPLIIDETGVTFSWNNNTVTLTPEKSMQIQHDIGADIMFAFDECTSPLNSEEYTSAALNRTDKWIIRCIKAHKEYQHKQALFAIVQGGFFEQLRIKSAKYMGKQDVPGFGIGGSLGKTKEDMYRILEWTMPHLPEEKPRHLLGIGQVRDIFESVERGVDLFDCVIPTREARHKNIYTKRGKVTLRLTRAAENPIDENCQCKACSEKITFAHLTKMFSVRDPKAFFYATVHNIQFFTDLMKEIREAIELNKLDELKATYYRYY